MPTFVQLAYLSQKHASTRVIPAEDPRRVGSQHATLLVVRLPVLLRLLLQRMLVLLQRVLITPRARFVAHVGVHGGVAVQLKECQSFVQSFAICFQYPGAKLIWGVGYPAGMSSPELARTIEASRGFPGSLMKTPNNASKWIRTVLSSESCIYVFELFIKYYTFANFPA